MKRKTPKRSVPAKIVYLFDVDNTLLDNDRVTADLKHHLATATLYSPSGRNLRTTPADLPT